MKRQLQTVDQVIDAFGGAKTAATNNKVVASWLGLNTSAVCNWRERKNIPSGWHLRFYLEAERRGMEVAKRVFGIEEEDAGEPAAKIVKAAKKKSGVRNGKNGAHESSSPRRAA